MKSHGHTVKMIKIHFRKKLITRSGERPLHPDFSFNEREFISFFGESGAGKTTALRVMAGLTRPEEGTIEVGEEIWLDTQKKINRAVSKRCVGYVPQDYALFPHMTVCENLEFALKDKSDKHLIDDYIARMRLNGLEGRKPAGLSVGDGQRVALIRALICRPKMLLLDEPLAALDGELRVYLQEELLNIHRQMKITTTLVTHDFYRK